MRNLKPKTKFVSIQKNNTADDGIFAVSVWHFSIFLAVGSLPFENLIS